MINKVLERDVDRAFMAGLKKLGLRSIKLSSVGPRGSSGYPDRLILGPHGRAIFIELKAPGRLTTPLQNERFSELDQLNYPVRWFDNAEQALAFVQREISQPMLVKCSCHRPGCPNDG